MWSAEKTLLFFSSRKSRVLILTILLSAVIHSFFFNLPPRGTHVWRQCNTLAVARNFYEEDMNILNPRVDRRGDKDGITGMQFPAYEFIVASCYNLFGFHEWVSRIASFLIFCFGIWAIYELFFSLFNSLFAAAIGAWSFCWSPELFYHGINALPDILALSASIAGFALFLKWRRTKTNFLIPIFVFLLALAGLTKIQFLAVGFPMCAIFIKDLIEKKYSLTEYITLIAGGIFAVLIPVLWYLHALQMIEQSGLRDYGISFRPANNWNSALNILTNNILIDVPETLLNYSGTAFFLIGIFYFFREKKWKNQWFMPVLIWALALLAYHIIELNQMEAHNYYAIPHIPFLMIPIVYGAIQLWNKKYFMVTLVLLVAQPILASARIIPARWTKNKINIPLVLYYSNSRDSLSSVVPDNKLCIVGPDKSGCIYFYFLHKKGFGFENPEDLQNRNENNVLMIETYISKGAQYLYTNNRSVLENPLFKKYFGKIISEKGEFKVIELKMPE